jgi:hypothetical protein
MLVRFLLGACVYALLSGPLASRVPKDEVRLACADTTALAVVYAGGSPVDAVIAGEWRARESGCVDDAISPDGQDCGPMQQRGVARHGRSCSELAADPVLAVRMWLEDLERLRGVCGTTFRALGALSGGKCGARPGLVRGRCLQAGLTAACEEKPS